MKKLSDRQKFNRQMEKLTGIKTVKKKTLSIEALKRKYEPIIRDLVIKRDGNRCQLKGIYAHDCEGRLVADHRPIPRGGGNHAFFDPKNLTTVCNGMNCAAQNWPVVNHAICEIVIKREGREAFDELKTRAKRKPFKVTEEYVLGIIRDLEAKYA